MAAALGLGVISSAGREIDLQRLEPVPATEAVPIQDFFRPLLLQHPSVNLAGTYIAALVTGGEDQHQLLIYDLKTQKMELFGELGDKDVYWYRWLGDDRVVFSLGAKKLYGLGLFAVDPGHLSQAYPVLQFLPASIVSVPPANPHFPLVWIRGDFESSKDRGVVKVNTNVKNGTFTNLMSTGVNWNDLKDVEEMNERAIGEPYPMPNYGLTYSYLADKDGGLEFAFTSEEGRLNVSRLTGEHWEKCPLDLETTDVVDCGNARGELAVIGGWAENKPRPLELVDAATGRVNAVMVHDAGYDFNGWLYRDPVSQLIVGAGFERNGPTMVWFDPGYAKLQEIMDKFFPKMVVRIQGSDRAGKIFLVATYSDRQPAIYYAVNLETRTVGLIKKSAPWIDPERMQPMSIIKFKTRDGRKLDAYVTMPKGASKAHPPPLIVLPHGGPWVRDTWGFDAEAQFFASRGYAVMQPNYRGSTGYDWMFPYEDRWAFRKMHDDVTDATKTMAASGWIDPKRIAIIGGSFGGYLAISGVVREPGLYRCAVSIAGVFDWAAHVREVKYNRFDNPQYDRLIRKLGNPSKAPERFAAISVLDGASQIKVPVFVAHGKDDPVVEISQSRRLIAELERGHVVHESMIVGEEGHGFGHLDNKVEMYSRIEAFLAKNLAATP